MGKRVKTEKTVTTLDLGYERTYQAQTPEGCGLLIGKMHGIGSRSSQQDSFGISELKEDVVQEKGALAILADGMGGMSGGEKASMAAVISCLHYFDSHDMGESLPESLVEMAENANREVNEILENGGEQGGSTLVAALVRDRELFWLSIGDSRLFLWRDGKLTQISRDHNYAADLQEQVEAGEISQEEALSDPQRAALTSYIGIECLEKMDYSTEPLALFDGDRILLVSDGVYNTLTVEEIEVSMQFPTGKAMMHMEMQIEAKRKKNQDNYTAVMLEVYGE